MCLSDESGEEGGASGWKSREGAVATGKKKEWGEIERRKKKKREGELNTRKGG